MTSTGPEDLDADELIRQLERTLGIAVLIESVDALHEGDGAVTIQATLMAGSNGTHVAVTGDSEAMAWEELAKAAIAWRNDDFQHITMWPGWRLTKPVMEAAEVLTVLDALDGAGIQVGITGGWGIDALLRRQTRPHGDVDLGLASETVDDAIDALQALGYVLVRDDRPARVELTSDVGQVDLHPIAWQPSGTGVQTGLSGETYEYPPGSLDADGEIGGRAVRCGTPQLQLRFHEGYEPSDRDRRDMEALAEAFGLSLPPPYSD